MVHIWREIFAALTALQGPYSVAVHQPEGGPDIRRLARAHFGAATPITSLAHAGHVLAAVSDGSASVGVLPLPGEDDPDIHSYGAGSRFNIFEDKNVWVGIDVARGPEDWAWYIQVNHPW